MVRESTGASYPAVSDRIIKASPIPLPPMDEQRRIAAILDKADGLRRKRRQTMAMLDAIPRSIFIEMFGDPVGNPMGFPLHPLGALGTLDRGVSKHRPRNDPTLLGGVHPLIQTGDVANSGGYIRSYTSTYSDLGLKQSKKWPAGTLCITIAANIAETGILTFPACFPDSVVGFTHKSNAIIEFVRVWLSFLRSTLEQSAPASAQKNINLKTLRELSIPLPPLDQIAVFESQLKMHSCTEGALCKASNYLDTLFASLQHRAFCGQL
jgi:type I restriction enzyme S subunit